MSQTIPLSIVRRGENNSRQKQKDIHVNASSYRHINNAKMNLSGHAVIAFMAFMLLASPSIGGEVQEFEKALRGTYADYRNALFMTNSSKQVESTEAILAFDLGWKTLSKKWQLNPPPQYVEDKNWNRTFSEVSVTIRKASSEISANKLPEAHTTLEAVRESVGNLHQRNNITSFSDRLNAYHLVMEQILTSNMTKLDSAGLQTLHEQSAVLKYLANETMSHPPSEAKGDAQFSKLSQSLTASVETMLQAVRTRDPKVIKNAAGQLKPAFSKLFLKFG